MKNLFIVTTLLLLSSSSFAMVESKTDTANDSQCLHKSFYEKLAKIDGQILNNINYGTPKSKKVNGVGKDS